MPSAGLNACGTARTAIGTSSEAVVVRASSVLVCVGEVRRGRNKTIVLVSRFVSRCPHERSVFDYYGNILIFLELIYKKWDVAAASKTGWQM